MLELAPEFDQLINDPFVVASLEAIPHPNDWFARRGKTQRDYILYCAATDTQKGEWVKKIRKLKQSLSPMTEAEAAKAEELMALRDAEHQRLKEALAPEKEFNKLIKDPEVVAKLNAEPHPNRYFAKQGKTRLDYILFCVEGSGAMKRNWLYKLRELKEQEVVQAS